MPAPPILPFQPCLCGIHCCLLSSSGKGKGWSREAGLLPSRHVAMKWALLPSCPQLWKQNCMHLALWAVLCHMERLSLVGWASAGGVCRKLIQLDSRLVPQSLEKSPSQTYLNLFCFRSLPPTCVCEGRRGCVLEGNKPPVSVSQHSACVSCPHTPNPSATTRLVMYTGMGTELCGAKPGGAMALCPCPLESSHTVLLSAGEAGLQRRSWCGVGHTLGHLHTLLGVPCLDLCPCTQLFQVSLSWSAQQGFVWGLATGTGAENAVANNYNSLFWGR